MRFLSLFIILSTLSFGGYWVQNNHPELKYRVLEMLNMGTIQALEARFTSKQIIDREHIASIQSNEPYIKFHPYLLIEVKFINSSLKTEEGIILWDLVDGEMVIDTKSWNKTHGFADCIAMNVDLCEFKILRAIMHNRGRANQQVLMHSLNVESKLLGLWIERACKKHLIVQRGNDYYIHLHNPCIDVKPSTHLATSLVTKSYKYNERTPCHYSPKQIAKIAKIAFGTGFSIRKIQKTFLPICCITIQNSDGSVQTTQWNSLTGKRIHG